MEQNNAKTGQARQAVQQGKTALGIEMGSTRIKAVLIDEQHQPIASGSFEWENRLENGVWTYHLDDVWAGLQASFKQLAGEVQQLYGVPLSTVGSLGVSAMMHGYLPFDKQGNQLVPFRTWRNTTTEKAAALLTEQFRFNIPQRWSIAHLYQAMLNKEVHVPQIDFLTTLAGYVHWKLTGKKVLGIGEASGMFPIDSAANQYNAGMIKQFNTLAQQHGTGWTLEQIMPQVLDAGDDAGKLTEAGAKLLDPTGALQAGTVMCPPEGDAGTGMVATNSVAERTGNVSAGTSIFAMIVLEKELTQPHTEIDMVTTPSGKPVAMVHCNNCSSDIDAWVRLFGEVTGAFGTKADKGDLYTTLYKKAMEADADGGGLLSYNYYSGEPITGFEEGRPLFARMPDSRFTLANFMRTLLFSALGTLKIGMDILTEREHVKLGQILGHGGFFKTPGVGQNLMAAALGVPVTVMESAGEGGAWGIAILAAYRRRRQNGETLESYLNDHVFAGNSGVCVQPDDKDAQGFAAFMQRYTQGLAIEQAAVDNLR